MMEEFDFLDEEKKEVRPLTDEEIKQNRYNRLSAIFERKLRGVQKLAIDKTYLKGSAAVELQNISYNAMYEAAKKGLYDDATNVAIITAHEQAEQLVADLNLLANSVRTVIAAEIEENADNVDALLDYAEGIKITRDDITEDAVNEIKEVYGL